MNNGFLSWDAIGVEKVPNDELFKILSGHFSISVPVDDLNVGGNVSRCGLESLIHGAIAINEPLGYFDGLAYSISISIIGFYYFSKWMGKVPGEIATLVPSEESSILDGSVVGVNALIGGDLRLCVVGLWKTEVIHLNVIIELI